MGLSLPGPVDWRVWAKAHGTHNAPLFPAGEVVLPRSGKENTWDLLHVGIGGPLMLGCSNVRITEEFPIFLMSHLMRLFGIPLGLEVSIKGLQGGWILLCHWLLLVFQRGGLVRRCRESDFCDCCMDEAYEGGLNVISKHGLGRSFQGMSEVGIVCFWRNIHELHAPFLAMPLGGSKAGMESSAANNTPY